MMSLIPCLSSNCGHKKLYVITFLRFITNVMSKKYAVRESGFASQAMVPFDYIATKTLQKTGDKLFIFILYLRMYTYIGRLNALGVFCQPSFG